MTFRTSIGVHPGRPRNAIGEKTTESAISPRTVEPIVRVQRNRPAVITFIRARTYELVNSPTRNPLIDARTIRQVPPKTDSQAACPVHEGAGGSRRTTWLMRV